jgi:succinyl-diaminopimelate desuccinylase
VSEALHLTNVEVLQREPTLDEPFLVRVLGSLVETESVNPGVYEAAMAKRVKAWLKDIPAEVTLIESLPGRHSLAAVLKGSGNGPRLVLNGHMDTVPIDDRSQWTTEPFGAEVKEGFLYGRGACDMKAGLTVQIAVAHYLARHLNRLKGTLVLHFAVGEECAEPGTLSLVEAGFVGDFGITTEPTELKVATAERGLAFYKIRIRGRSIHASRAHLGINPVPRLRAVLDTIEAYEREVKQRQHPLLPGGSCTPTMVKGGVKENAVPDYCELVLDRRLLPGETVEGEMDALRSRLEEITSSDPDFEFEISRFPNAFEPAEIDRDSHFAKHVLAAVEEVTGAPTEIYGTPYASDVRNLVNDAGMEAVTFGPGNVGECHCADERVSLKQVRDAALVTAKVASDLLL